MQMKFCSCLSSRGELFKAGFTAKFEFRSESLKSKYSLFFCLQFDDWMLQKWKENIIQQNNFD